MAGHQRSSPAFAAGGDMPAGRSIVQTGLDQARQALLSADDVPLALIDELVAAVTSRGVKSALEARIEMIVRHGHTAENDDMLPIGWLPMEARQWFERVRDVMPDKHRDIGEIRRMLVDGVAHGLAAIDRIDRATKGER